MRKYEHVYDPFEYCQMLSKMIIYIYITTNNMSTLHWYILNGEMKSDSGCY